MLCSRGRPTFTSSFTRLSWRDPPPAAFVFCINARASCTWLSLLAILLLQQQTDWLLRKVQ